MGSQPPSDVTGQKRRIERAKGIFDNASSLEEMIEHLELKKQELERLAENGWQLEDETVTNDYAELRKPNNSTDTKLSQHK